MLAWKWAHFANFESSPKLYTGFGFFSSIIVAICFAILIGFAACTFLGPQMGIDPLFTPKIFIQAFSIAIVVGIIGGIYPAIKAVKLPPTEALRYE